MRHLETYRIFEAKKAIELNTKQVAFLNKYVTNMNPGRRGWDVSYSTDPPTVNIFTNLDTNQWGSGDKKIKSLQRIHFGKISGNFNLQDIEISTFEGFPKEVEGNFKLGYNVKLNVPFEEFPEVKIGGDLELSIRGLESLVGCPEEVGSLSVWTTGIMDMTGCPKRYTNPSGSGLKYEINLIRNERLISLEGLPKEIDSRIINIGDGKTLYPSRVRKEKLIQGFEDFQKTGTWTPYYVMLKQNADLSDWDEGMKSYLDSKINPEAIQKFIDLDPSKAAIALKGMWTEMKQDPRYSGVKFPEGYAGDADLVADLSDIGL
jgi:hypothetical protein